MWYQQFEHNVRSNLRLIELRFSKVLTNSYFSLCVSYRLQPAVPLKLKSKEEVNMFFDGTLPKLAKEATDIAVLGMFGDEKRKGKVWVRRNVGF